MSQIIVLIAVEVSQELYLCNALLVVDVVRFHFPIDQLGFVVVVVQRNHFKLALAIQCH